MALTLGNIWDTIQTIIRKESEGLRLSPEQFEHMLKICSLELFDDQLAEYDKKRKLKDMLVRFRTSATVTLTSGSGSLPTLYSRIFQMIVTSSNYPIDVIDEKLLHMYLGDDVFAPTATNPIAVLQDGVIQVYPTTGIASITCKYLAFPADPVFDWCIEDSTDAIVYMPVLSTIRTGNDLYTGAVTGTLIKADVTHPDSPSIPYTSTSVELDWDEPEKKKILYMILQKLGLNLSQNQLTQYGLNEENQELTKQQIVQANG